MPGSKSRKLFDITVLRYLVTTMGNLKYGVLLLTVILAVQGFLGVCYALFLKDIIDAAVAGERELFFKAIIKLALLFLSQIALSSVGRYIDEYTASGLENKFKSRLFDKLLKRDFSMVSSLHSGEWMNRLTSDTVVVAYALVDILPGVAGMVVKLVGAIVMIIVLEPRFLYLIVPGGILLIVFSAIFRKKMKSLHKNIQEKDGSLRTYLQETLGSLLVVRSYGVEKSTLCQSKLKMGDHKKARMMRNHFSNFCNVGFGLVMQGASVLGAFFCGYGILIGTMSYGNFTAVISLLAQIQSPFANISGYLPRYYAMIASAERLMEIETFTSEGEKTPLSVTEVQERYARTFDGFGLENAEFFYPVRGQSLSANMQKTSQSPLPKKMNLFVGKGEYVAFSGPSGCGKSTVLKLLMSLYPLDSGERYVVISGKRALLDGEWQSLFAYVPQGNHLMSGSIREIVSYANPDALDDDEKIRLALSAACAEFVYELEKGIDTVLGERGTGISEGQMQRLAIARAVFSERPVLMLDECTSALDEATEAKLLKNLREMTNRTVVIITHRKSVFEICDKIVNFENNA
ncbi:MAG: ABC transporter ATP-binding protein [Fibrobacter sp.]|nr:ABC transporter ATP-binding protein [Fibrobacter sp.]